MNLLLSFDYFFLFFRLRSVECNYLLCKFVGYTQGEVTSQSLRSRYDRHFVGITRYKCVELNGEDLLYYSNKIESVS